LTSPKEIAPVQIARGGMAPSFPLVGRRKRRNSSVKDILPTTRNE
jgi:hypothetical protein